MGPIEITVIVLVSAFMVGFIANYIYRKVKKLPTGECACCGSHKRKNALVRKYHKKYGKKEDHSCCCHCHDKDQNDPEESCSCNK